MFVMSSETNSAAFKIFLCSQNLEVVITDMEGREPFDKKHQSASVLKRKRSNDTAPSREIKATLSKQFNCKSWNYCFVVPQELIADRQVQ